MNIEVLISTMNMKSQREYSNLLKKMNLNNNTVVINQCPNFEKCDLLNIVDGNNKLLSFKEKGLSSSRNKAIENSSADICVIADDDLTYNNDYIEIISKAYKKYSDADIIAFYVESVNKERPTTNQSEGRVSWISSMKISSFQITFKRKSIISNNIIFDSNFGAGSGEYTSGEENIFLFDCLKKKLKIYYIPVSIATVDHKESTWFSGYNENLFITKGAVYYRMSGTLSIAMIIQFAIRKYNLYRKEISFFNAIKLMCVGRNKIKKEKKNEEN